MFYIELIINMKNIKVSNFFTLNLNEVSMTIRKRKKASKGIYIIP